MKLKEKTIIVFGKERTMKEEKRKHLIDMSQWNTDTSITYKTNISKQKEQNSAFENRKKQSFNCKNT